jgi:hypothetical protein
MHRVLIFVTLAFFVLPIVFTQCAHGTGVFESNPEGDFKVMREKMAKTQIKGRG